MSDAIACVVCGDEVTPAMSASCNWCSGRFHLNQRNDVEAKDCGEVWIDEQFLALQFACAACLSGTGESAAPERVRPAAGDAAPRGRRYKRRA